MSIAFESVTTATNASTTPFSFSHTNTSGDCLAFKIGVRAPGTSGDDVTVKYNGVSMTEGVSLHVDFKDSYIFYLVNPATGSNTVEVTYTGDVESAMAALSFTGVDQSTPVGASGTNSTGSGSSITTNITTETANSWIVDCFLNGGGAHTEGGGQTSRFAVDTPTNGMSVDGSTKPTTVAGANSTSWTPSATTALTLINLELKEAAAGVTFTPKIMMF